MEVAHLKLALSYLKKNTFQEVKGMKKIYANPILEVISLEQNDIVTSSPTDGDNILDDGFFD